MQPSPQTESTTQHWEHVYEGKPLGAMSWFEPSPRSSLAMIDSLRLPSDAPIIDAGGGASHLAAELLDRGHTDITVADISGEALELARRALPEPDRVSWVVADLRTHRFGRRFALWHDRALFHFMVDAADRQAYLATLERSLTTPGHLILATFGPRGPTSCSGLPTARYGAETLAAEFDGVARLVSSHLEEHRTPSGACQQFLFAHLIAPVEPPAASQ
jgi:ubiquinone/menaquinone biosynthesis C-methylase UbiE